MRTCRPARLAIGPALGLSLVLVTGAAVSATPSHAWTRQFGSATYDYAHAAAVDSSGHLLIVGATLGSVAGRPSKGGWDAFVRKYRPNGTIAWTRQFGSANDDYGLDVAVDATGNAYVAGSTDGSIAGRPSRGGTDAFVRKYRPNGTIAWTRQFGSVDGDYALAVAADPSGRAHVAGYTDGSITGLPSKGLADAFVRKYRPNGTIAWTRQFGSVDGDYAESVAVDRSGHVLVAGYTYGSITGLPSKGVADAFVRKLRPSGGQAWTRQLGSAEHDTAYSVATDREGNVLVAGSTFGSITGKPSYGLDDAFVRKYRSSGAKVWTRQFGTPGFDFAFAVATDASGRVYLAGQTGTTPDAYVRMLKPGGQPVWLRRFGSAGPRDWVVGVGLDSRGDIYVGGGTEGTLPGQTSRGKEDAFVRKYRR